MIRENLKSPSSHRLSSHHFPKAESPQCYSLGCSELHERRPRLIPQENLPSSVRATHSTDPVAHAAHPARVRRLAGKSSFPLPVLCTPDEMIRDSYDTWRRSPASTPHEQAIGCQCLNRRCPKHSHPIGRRTSASVELSSALRAVPQE